MASTDQLVSGITALIMIGLVIGGIVLALDGFQDAIEDDTPCLTTSFIWNSTNNQCNEDGNSSNSDTNMNYQYNVTQEGLEGVSNASSYLSTIGTLLGVAALIAVVIGAFMFARR